VSFENYQILEFISRRLKRGDLVASRFSTNPINHLQKYYGYSIRWSPNDTRSKDDMTIQPNFKKEDAA